MSKQYEVDHDLDGGYEREFSSLAECATRELGEDAVNGGQADVHVLGDEQTVHVFGGEVTIVGLLEEVEDLEPRRSGLEADVLEVLGIAGHGGPGTCTRWPAGAASPI